MPADPELRKVMYERVCESYHKVDDFRMKLLGLLPVATGTGVFLLLSGKAELLGEADSSVADAVLAIGAFGFLFTVGLFAYELFGIKKCHYLIVAGKRLETDMGVAGQFRSRPTELAGFINEPYASAIIYPASMAAWAFLALSLKSVWAATALAVVVLVGGYKATRVGARRIKENQQREELILRVVATRGPMTLDTLRLTVGGEHEPSSSEINEHPTKWVEPAVERLRELGDLRRDDELLRVP